MSFASIDDIEELLKSDWLTVRDLYAMFDCSPVQDSSARMSAGRRSERVRQVPWLEESLRIVLLFTGRALEMEEFLLVCDVAREALAYWRGSTDEDRTNLVRLRIDYAEALTRLGFTRDARRELEPCAGDDFRPRLGRIMKAEILLRLGNILRDEAPHAMARAAQLQTAREALDFYRRSLALDPERLEALGLAAAASMVLSEPDSALREEAHEKAHRILEITAKLEDTVGPRVQTTRTRATAYGVLGDVENARECYSRLSTLERVSTTVLADARYYSQFLAEALGKPRDLFKSAFPPLQLIVFVGHLPDLPGASARFPRQSIEPVKKAMREKLKKLDARVGLVSAAAGADLLFIEAMRERGAAVHLLLPWAREEFRQSSVSRFDPEGGPAEWGPLFDRALKEAATIREIGQAYKPDRNEGWEYLKEVTAGMAIQAARASRLDVQPMVLWDGHQGWGVGGTASFVELWRHELGREVETIALPEAPSDGGRTRTRRGAANRCEQPTLHQEVKSMLFADIVGYSRLPEGVIPRFVEFFLNRISLLASQSKHAPCSFNTWGDGIYAVFDHAYDAGCFALELTQMIREGEDEWRKRDLCWEEAGGDGEEPIKRSINVRVGLHTGPVFLHYDPVVRRLGYTGAHVNRAARIEPIAKPGEVYASEEFAALSELDAEIKRHASGGGELSEPYIGFVCQYAGSMQLAKNYPGRFRIYRVLPRRVFAVEELAKAAHEAYCDEAQARGEKPVTNSSMRKWDELSEDLRDANRAQVADIPNKLRHLGYELAPSFGIMPSSISITDAQIEKLGIAEHNRWMRDRELHGWAWGRNRDNARKLHPLMVDWSKLSEPEKEKDRDTVRNLPKLIERAGLRLRKLETKHAP